MRVIALYILHRDGVPDEDRRRLYQHARLSLAEQDAVNALALLGVRISRGPGDRDIRRKLKQKTSTEEEYELSRFKPLLCTVLEENVSGRLDGTLFPYVKDAPLAGTAVSPRAAPPPQATSLRSAKPSWHKAPAVRVGGGPADNRQRLLVFVAGGMTYSEMREAYQMSGPLGKEIIIGATEFSLVQHSSLTGRSGAAFRFDAHDPTTAVRRRPQSARAWRRGLQSPAQRA